MTNKLVLTAGCTPASGFARFFLEAAGIPVVSSPSPDVTHLLLDVPSFESDGRLRDGSDLQVLLSELSPDVTVCGGGLNHPCLGNRGKHDLLDDPLYLALNAYITAECALDVALPRLPCLIRGCEVAILGWGRIGKCLAQLMKNLEAQVTVAARKESDRAIIHALGYDAIPISHLADALPQFRLIFNTVPHPVMPESLTRLCRGDCIKIDLASQPGMAGTGVITARGLPGLHRPESSGKLITETLLRLIGKETSL